MNDQQEFWNEKYQSGDYFYGKHVNDYLKQQLLKVEDPQQKKLLELACGEGRNSVWSALQGFQVCGLDVSDRGLEKVSLMAKEHLTTVETVHSNVFEYDNVAGYDILTMTYLHMMQEQRQKLYEKCFEFLKPGGQLIAEWYHPNQRNHNYTSGGPPTPNMMITLSELENSFENEKWKILDLHYQLRELKEGTGHVGLAAVVQITAEKR